MTRCGWLIGGVSAGVVSLLGGAAGYVFVLGDPFGWLADPRYRDGMVLDTLNGVPVYDHGRIVSISHGRHYAADGTYFGQRWQCVEFVKRYLYVAKGHRMPDGMGHAKSFYDPVVAHGALNASRGLIQFVNGGTEPPRPDDLLVLAGFGYGHVAIVSKVSDSGIEVVQQNIYGYPRQTHALKRTLDGGYAIDSAFGWLRVPAARAADGDAP